MTICAGSEAPEGKCSDSRSCATTDSGLSWNISDWVSPSEIPAVDSASTPVTATDISHDQRGRRATRAPIRDHTVRSLRAGVPKRGTNGQNTQRPASTSSAGSTVTMARNAQTTPTAPTSPSEREELMSARARQARPTAMVPAEASTAGPERVRAIRIARCRSSCRCSSSR